MRNQELAEIFDQIADYLELRGENRFKVGAYRRGASVLRGLTEDIAEVAARGALQTIDHIGPALAEKITDWLTTGEIPLYEELKAERPISLLDVMRIPGVGPKLAARLHDELGVRNMDDLAAVIEAKRLQTLKGCGPRTEARIAEGIARLREGEGRRPIGTVFPRANQLVATLAALEGVERAALAGSLRRGVEMVKDVDVVLAVSEEANEGVRSALAQLPGLEALPNFGPTKCTLVLTGGLSVDIRLVPERSYVTALHHFTGSKEHHIRLRERARRKGWRISEYDLQRLDDESVIHPRDEAELYDVFGLPYIPPELREDGAEIEAAAHGELPQLIEAEDVRGDIHVHSTWSDGRASLEEIAEQAGRMGLEYVVICDHSPALRITRGLDPARLEAQAEEIDAINARGEGAYLLKGIEVDILLDGTLDLPDEVLERLDLVVASVHSGFDQSEADMTARLLRAIENPHVDVIGHPTGRLLGRRSPYAVNIDALIERAAQTGTVLEINSSPERLDLNATHARWASEAGVPLVLSTDAHGLEELGNYTYGLMVARRAWLEPDDIINTRGLDALRDWLRRPKSERRP